MGERERERKSENEQKNIQKSTSFLKLLYLSDTFLNSSVVLLNFCLFFDLRFLFFFYLRETIFGMFFFCSSKKENWWRIFCCCYCCIKKKATDKWSKYMRLYRKLKKYTNALREAFYSGITLYARVAIDGIASSVLHNWSLQPFS